MCYITMHAASSSAHFILQVPPTAELPGPAFQPNVLTDQQDRNPTIQNCSCALCSAGRRTQAGPPTWYPVELQDPRYFGVSSLYDDHTTPQLIAPLQRTSTLHI